MPHSYQFRLEIIKLVTEQNFGIREVAQLHQISHSIVISWLKAFHEQGLEGVKSPCTKPKLPKIMKPKMKEKEIEIPEPPTCRPKLLKSYSGNWLTYEWRLPI